LPDVADFLHGLRHLRSGILGGDFAGVSSAAVTEGVIAGLQAVARNDVFPFEMGLADGTVLAVNHHILHVQQGECAGDFGELIDQLGAVLDLLPVGDRVASALYVAVIAV
jgi:hypothetical protein